MNMKYIQNPTDKLWKRHFLIKILYAALAIGENRFTHQVALAWLAYYPGDLLVKLLRAQALLADGYADQCLTILQDLITRDPENREAYELIQEAQNNLNLHEDDLALGCTIALGRIPKHIDTKTTKNLLFHGCLLILLMYLLFIK